MLYVEINGSSFAQKNFGLEEKVYVIVATEMQWLVGLDRIERVDYEFESPDVKYVALAALNEDGTYNLNDVIHLTEDELGLATGESELKLAYSYVLTSFDNFATVEAVEPTATKTVQNYGDNGEKIVGATKYNNVGYSNIVKIDGITYSLVEEYSVLNNKSSQVGKTPELIVHSMYEDGEDLTNAYYYYDQNGNIYGNTPNETTKAYELYLYNFYGAYYVITKDAAGNDIYRVATEADFAKCAFYQNTNYAGQWGVETKASDLTTISFSEITMIDDNGDGVWDRAVYIPYSVGKYGTSTSSKTMWDIKNSYSSGSQTAASPSVNGEYLWFWATDTSGNWETVGVDTKNSDTGVIYTDYTNSCYVRESDIDFAQAGEGKPKKNDYIVYYYNPYSRDFVVVENLGAAKKGTVQTMNQGAYAYDTTNKTYYYKGATVTIDGETYGLGYRPYETGSYLVTKSGVDLVYLDSALANYGWNENLYKALMGQAYNTMSYVVLAGRLIQTGNPSNACGWIAFDIGEASSSTVNGYTTWDYEGDIIGVDENGNILVSAYVDKTGEPVIAKIGSINGYNYGLLVEDYAALQYQFSGVGILGSNAYDTMKRVVIHNFFDQLNADLNAKDASGKDVDGIDQNQYVFIVTGIDADGVYNIYTDLNIYWPNGTAWYQPTAMKQTSSITFYDGLSNKKHYTNTSGNDADETVKLHAESVILIAGKDGFKVATGIPADGKKVDFSNAAGAKAYAYSISSDFIFIASKDMLCKEIYSGPFDDVSNASKGYNYYMVMGRYSADNYEAETTAYATFDGGKYVYTYKNIYNLTTGANETITTSTPLPNYAMTSGIFGTTNATKPIGMIYAEKNGEFVALTHDIVSKTYTSGTYTINYQIAADSYDVITDLLYGGYTDTVSGKFYGALYDYVDVLDGAAPSSNILLLQNGTDKYDAAVTFKYDVITYDSFGQNIVDIRLTNNDRASNNNHKNALIFYNYEAGVGFVGTAIKDTDTYKTNDDKANGDEDNVLSKAYWNEIAAERNQALLKAQLAAAIKDAKAAIDAAAGDSAVVKTIVDEAKAVLAGYQTLADLAAATVKASDITDVNALATKAVADIKAALGQASADSAALAQAKADAKALFTMIFADVLGTTDYATVACAHNNYGDEAKHLAAFLREIDDQGTLASVAAYVEKYASDTSDYWAGANLRAHIAANKTASADAATLAAAKTAFATAQKAFVDTYAALAESDGDKTNNYPSTANDMTVATAYNYVKNLSVETENDPEKINKLTTEQISFWTAWMEDYIDDKEAAEEAAEAAKPVKKFDADIKVGETKVGGISAKNYFGSVTITSIKLTAKNVAGIYEDIATFTIAAGATTATSSDGITVTKTWDAATQTSTFAFTKVDAMNNTYSILLSGATYGVVVNDSIYLDGIVIG